MAYRADERKQKVTLTLPAEVVRAYRIAAAREGVRDSQVVAEALRQHLGIGALEVLQDKLAALGLSEDEAEEAAMAEVRAHRQESRNPQDG
jgi:predicted RNA-binding protein with PUA domain